MKVLNLIGGEFVDAISKNTIDNFNPALGQKIGTVPDSDAEDVELAVKAAQSIQKEWASSSLETRFDLLNRLSEGILSHLDELAELESIDTGKPLSLSSTVDIPRAAHNFQFFATAAVQFASESHETPQRGINYTLRRPLGVVGCISPWNLPLYLFTWKIAPALATGNCVIAKPSEVTPLTAFRLGQIAQEVGFPAGVLNILQGQGHKVGNAMVSHPAIKAISFTGSTAVGARIAATAAPMFKKISLELGGKNPNIIFDDCDFEKALETTVLSSFRNSGQICLCGSRILVQEGIYEKFKQAFAEKAKNLIVGDPSDKVTQIGSVVSNPHFDKVLSYIDLAQKEGGRILAGGHPIKLTGRCKNGWFIAPTIIENLPQVCRTNQEEIFGPVVTIQPFKTTEEAIALANGVPYGLSCTVWTTNLLTAQKVSSEIEAGIVWVNTWMLRDLRTPFGGVKNSGVGREGGWEAMRFFTEPKNVTLAY